MPPIAISFRRTLDPSDMILLKRPTAVLEAAWAQVRQQGWGFAEFADLGFGSKSKPMGPRFLLIVPSQVGCFRYPFLNHSHLGVACLA